jgi:trk/ktr system potassium uptake protein
MRIALVKRDDATTVATASTVLQAGDLVTVCGPPDVLFEVRSVFDPAESGSRSIRVVIMGGGEMGVSLVRLLSNPRIKLRIIERDIHRCRFLADRFPNVTVIHGEGTSLRLLEEEHVGDADFFVACTRDDEDNVMTCLQARKLGVQRVMLAINRADYNEIVQTSKATLGVDVAVSPRLATAAEVLRYVSREKYTELAKLPGDAGRLIEVKVAPKSELDGRTVRDVNWPVGSVILAVQHRGEARTPGPEDIIHAGDRLVTLLQPQLLEAVLRLVT